MTSTEKASVSPRVQLGDVEQTYTTDAGEQVHALTPTSVTVEPGEFVCIVGPSGCGKTTLLRMIAGFLRPTHGQVLLDDRPISGPGPDRGVVFQHANLFPWLTVEQNVELSGRFRKISEKNRRAEAERYLDMVNLSEFGSKRPYELSGGMQQRAQIARVLAGNPSILLMDEPFGALDALTRETLQHELIDIWRKDKKTVFFVTHSVDEAVLLSSRVWVMSARPGRIIEDIPSNVGDPTAPFDPAELRTDPEFQRLRKHIAEAIYAAQGATLKSAAGE
ncbi:ABC transporter ATP-binding protein [Corynebacterium heidelbergense]|uniref:Taurine ABC transporter ATP-binding protein n=1 Tax=Corynebacterium heidelbergense TaxID=2055947 RepID=A0A364VBY9_9CORY|nr:ABC transporter ATP-binding protein [Corynebacterium heidelbergense]RAV34165.1 taurine ABC transporter ATP-binding protein [Corynebacterium heidelbergense]WCZ37599.1 Bicarbonate transport ATP-binding protein CmpD [Corynebacterium heidelbergense]